jgi:hypothetical protein
MIATGPMEKIMSIISKSLHAGWISVQYVIAWQRKICSRSGTDDARRARSRRLLMQLSGAGEPISGYPCGLEQSVADANGRKYRN